MKHYKLLADMLLPDVKLKPENVFARYPKRDLAESAKVTRFAPSPTGMLHVGALYAALAFERLAHQSGGVCFLRIEDTDRKREVSGSIHEIINSLNYFGIGFDEGPDTSGGETGNYGPYRQSRRAEIYKVFVKDLIVKGLAYPCFCSADELAGIRSNQRENNVRTGYHGEWARCRNITLEQAENEMDKGKPFVIRLKSPGSPDNRISFTDLIKGGIEMQENDQDIVLLKSDGLPTYHFAHAVDDRLMGTTHVLRADEWIASVPVHLQLFDVLGFNRPCYGHISPIMKMDGQSKRKFSKRKDPDGDVKFYIRKGYPVLAVIEYFMCLLNSNFEEWRADNPLKPYTGFPVEIGKMSASGALLDMNKLNDVSRDVVSRFSAEEVYSQACDWAQKYDAELSDLLKGNMDYAVRIFNIGRGGIKPRKDIAAWSEIIPVFSYFFDELYSRSLSTGYAIPASVTLDVARKIVSGYIKVFDYSDDREIWFEKVKNLAAGLGFAGDMKLYRKNPESYSGNVADVAMVLRIALTNRTNTPDLFDVMNVMGPEMVRRRLEMFLFHFVPQGDKM